jgi:2-amino-4-hydroxy-6-hydroxymethyldihydropteridine diphosphokinase
LNAISQSVSDESIVIALGSNLAGGHASCEALLEAALARFPAHGMIVTARSGWWRSAAWPDPAAPAYFNGVALVETALTPRETLEALHGIEREFGRERGEINAARTLDLDLIAHGRLILGEPGLHLPHPRAHERLFVMGPLAEIAPLWRHPAGGKTAALLAAGAPVGRDAYPLS